MLVGIGLSMLVFIFEYSRSRTTEVLCPRSNIIRGFKERTFLAFRRKSIVFIGIHGYVFFGSALRILREVKEKVIVRREFKGLISTNFLIRLSDIEDPFANSVSPEQEAATQFVVLNCENMTGLDATAARSCFVELKQLLREYQIQLLLTNVQIGVTKLLQAHNVLPADLTDVVTDVLVPRVFNFTHDALQYCEEQLLREFVPGPATTRNVPSLLPTPSSTVRHHELVDILASFMDNEPHSHDDLLCISEFATKLTVNSREQLFAPSDPSDHIYFVQSGEFELIPVDDSPRLTFLKGCLFGQISFILRSRREANARCLRAGSLFAFSRAEFERMQQDKPLLGNIFKTILLKGVCLTVSSLSRYDNHDL